MYVCGQNPVLPADRAGCGRQIIPPDELVYRCVDCGVPFHRECLAKHCASDLDSERASHAETRRALEEARRWRDDAPAAFLAQRGVEPGDACPGCSGWGVRAYGSTATWHGGIGGQAITSDVCNKCWGSGSKTRPWLSYAQARSLESERDAALRERDSMKAEWLAAIAIAENRDSERDAALAREREQRERAERLERTGRALVAAWDGPLEHGGIEAMDEAEREFRAALAGEGGR